MSTDETREAAIEAAARADHDAVRLRLGYGLPWEDLGTVSRAREIKRMTIAVTAAAPLIEAAARADERRKVAEEIALAIEHSKVKLDPFPWADGYNEAIEHAAAIARATPVSTATETDCDGCTYWSATGAHWDTCPNRPGYRQ